MRRSANFIDGPAVYSIKVEKTEKGTFKASTPTHASVPAVEARTSQTAVQNLKVQVEKAIRNGDI